MVAHFENSLLLRDITKTFIAMLKLMLFSTPVRFDEGTGTD